MVTATSVARSSSRPDSRYSASVAYPAVVDAAVVRIAVPTSSGRFAGRVSHPASPATYRISPNATATLAAKTPTAMNAAMRASRGATSVSRATSSAATDCTTAPTRSAT